MKEDVALPLIVILGPTASGKSAVAIQLAQVLNGEIICADSRTVYRGMNIGTAKPTVTEMQGVPHWALDLIEPNQRFTLYDFQRYTWQKIDEIRSRGHVPMLVGGSGLYIDCILYNYELTNNEVNPRRRAELEQMSTEELVKKIQQQGLELPRDIHNKRRLVRALELGKINHTRSPRRSDAIVVGIKTDLATLRQRIAGRGEVMLRQGLIDEVKALDRRYGDVEPLRRNIYGVVKKYLRDEIGYEQIPDEITKVDYHLARKQLTYWRGVARAKDIWWLPLQSVEGLTTDNSSVLMQLYLNHVNN